MYQVFPQKSAADRKLRTEGPTIPRGFISFFRAGNEKKKIMRRYTAARNCTPLTVCWQKIRTKVPPRTGERILGITPALSKKMKQQLTSFIHI
jgi:hypothetical protein